MMACAYVSRRITSTVPLVCFPWHLFNAKWQEVAFERA